MGSSNVIEMKLWRDGDQKRPQDIFTESERNHLKLMKIYDLFYHGTDDGTDIYKEAFFEENLIDHYKLSEHTRAVHNLIPFIVNTDIDLICTNAKLENIRVFNGKNETDEQMTETLIDEIIGKQWPMLKDETLENGNVKGDAYIQVIKKKDGKIRFNVFKTDYVFPKYDKGDISNLLYFEIKYDWYDEFGNTHTFVMKIDGKGQEVKKNGKVVEKETFDHGWNYIPIVHIKNIHRPGKSHGKNSFSHHIPLLNIMNHLQGNWLHGIDLYGNPKLTVRGASSPKDGFHSSDAKTIDLPKGAEIGLLEYKKLGELQERIKTLLSIVKVQIPEFSIISDGNDDLSGFSRKLKMAPILAKINKIQPNYERGFAEVFNIALNMFFSNKDLHDFGVVFPLGDPMPQNEKETLEIVAMELDNGLTNLEQAMKRIGKDARDIQAILDAEKEVNKIEEMMNQAEAVRANRQKIGAE